MDDHHHGYAKLRGTRMRMEQRGTALAVAGLTAAAVVLGTAAPAQAATPKRNDSKTEAVLLVHGIDWVGEASFDCRSGWKNLKSEFKEHAWKGSVRSVAFYKKDKNCDLRIASAGVNDGIHKLGKALAKKIYSEYTSRGKSVDLVGHSMGGLVIRDALSGVAKKQSGYPAKLYVEDVVTLGTPHNGTNSSLCVYTPCAQMWKNSHYLELLKRNPQSAQGTDWTAIASDADEAIGEDTATGGGVRHWVRYKNIPGKKDHSLLRTTRDKTLTVKWRNLPEAATGWRSGDAPLDKAFTALYWHSRW
ncbi:lipase family alpha/beta hydrolase [Streptomyces sp. NPDC014894]|uniref:lipase family alpha/beta hydrolase n=1 Tax=Streptomyces sp. NPDC014894 TaxID=3364931 RepID=UPI0036F68C76